MEVEGGVGKTRGARWRERKEEDNRVHTKREAGLDGERNTKRESEIARLTMRERYNAEGGKY